MTRTLRSIQAAALAAALAACGGNGSKSGRDISYAGPTTLVAVTDANAARLAASGYAGLGAFKAGSTAAPLVTGVSGRAPAVGLRALSTRVMSMARPSGAAAAGVGGTQSGACANGGSATSTVSVANPLAGITSGDYMAVSFSDCVDAAFAKANGSVRLDFLLWTPGAVMGDPATMTPGGSYQLRMTMGDYSTEDQAGAWSGMDGNMTLSYAVDDVALTETVSITGGSIAMAEGVGSKVTNAFKLLGLGGAGSYSMDGVQTFTDGLFSVLASEASGFSGRICTLEIAGCVDVALDPPFLKLAGQPYPASGTFTVTGMAGRFVSITAIDGVSGAIDLSWDAGAGLVGPLRTDWACLAQADPSTCLP
jgi:hypothetical protein